MAKKKTTTKKKVNQPRLAKESFILLSAPGQPSWGDTRKIQRVPFLGDHDDSIPEESIEAASKHFNADTEEKAIVYKLTPVAEVKVCTTQLIPLTKKAKKR
jgi:hypothetical protein